MSRTGPDLGPRPPRRVRQVARRAGRGEVMAALRRLPLQPDVVLYESFAGNGMLCNPEALFRTLLDDPRHAALQHVWVLDDPAEHPRVLAEFDGDDRVRLVRRGSMAYLRHLATAGLLVNNATFVPDFGKRAGQVYLNTWHGTPVKTMGYDIPGGGPGTGNIVRNFLQADYLLSSGPYMTERMYASAYRLRNILPGAVVEAGQPRTDRQFVPREEARRLVLPGPGGSAPRIVVYAPTWRGSSFAEPDDESDALAERVRQLAGLLGPGWEVRVKVHQAVHRAARGNPGLAGVLVDNDIPTNLVLAGCDVLVSDYSSIVVDYLGLDRPMVFHVPDLDEYRAGRGLYLDPREWPGPVHRDISDVARAVQDAVTGADPYAARRREWRERLCPEDDGAASRRVVEAVLHGDREHLVDIVPDGRRKVLLFVGAMRSNGITTSALNLLRHIDHTRYDVSVVFPNTQDREALGNIARIDPRVRVLPRVGGITGGAAAQLARQVVQRRGVGARAEVPLRSMFSAEWARCFGGASFDAIVDFMGYGAFWDLLLLQGPAASRSIWLHNDMLADAHRVVRGRRPLLRTTQAVFSTYRYFDHLVSVSAALRDVNRAKLAEYAAPAAFTFAPNLIDVESVRAGSGHVADDHPGGADGRVTFVAVGRLSSAKNFARLIAAYALLRGDHPDTRVVILGEGPERASLEALIARLGVSDGVLLAGHRANPYGVMARADCFVLSSDHEGQPMAILEALVLGLPIITTRFSSVDSALPEGCGLVVDPTVGALRDGMAAFLGGRVPACTFDAAAYNRAAVQQFYAAIGLPGDELPHRS